MWHCGIKYFLIPQLFIYFLLAVGGGVFIFLFFGPHHKSRGIWSLKQGWNTFPDETLSHFPTSVVAQIKHWTAKETPDQIFLFVSNQLFLILLPHSDKRGFPGGSDGKESVYNAGDPGSTPGLGRSPGEGNGSSRQYSCLENPMDRGAWQGTVHGIAKSWTWLRD